MTGHEGAVDQGPKRAGVAQLGHAGLRHPEIPAHEMLAGGWAPVGVIGHDVVIATSASDIDRVRRVARRWLPGRRLSFRTVDHVALQDALVRNRENELADHMANNFPRTHPDMTGKGGFAWWQVTLAVLCAAATLPLLVLAPATLAGVLSVALLASAVVNVAVARSSLRLRRRDMSSHSRPTPTDADLPFYTVVIPAYHEEEVVGDLVRNLADLDYPRDRLEVLFLVEKHDPGTRAVILDAGLEPHMRIVDLPPGPPQTKPRACNLGLLLARGDLLVIFDAEDHPDRDQLRKVAHAFADAPDDKLACVQAKLFFHNARRNWLTHQFAMEYDLRYEMILPGLASLGLPIPLGGTSNHFRTDVLRRMGGWDAWNVTEDADLGMRCKALGYRVDVIDSITWEEATSATAPWIRQRTRWHKGFMMTTLVHTRRPLRTLRRFGPAGMVTLLGVVAGTVLNALCQPAVALLLLLDLCGVLKREPGTASTASIALFGLLVPTVLWVAATMVAARRRKTPFAVLGLSLPGYWVLHWIAAWRALIQLIRSPFRWEKTPHHTTAAAKETE